MTETETAPANGDVQQEWQDLQTRVERLEVEKSVLEQETKALRLMLESAIAHRQKSHTELIMLLTTLVSKLPINELGVIVSRLVEHNESVAHFLTGLIKGTSESSPIQPAILKSLDQTRRDLAGAAKPLIQELIHLESPFETELLKSLASDPEQFFSPRMLRANRCFLKGQVPRERICRECGEESLVLFNDMTTDPKLNPRPKPEEIVLCFKNDFESLLAQAGLPADKQQHLLDLYQRVQRSKAATDQAWAQRNVFLKLSFLIELLHYYEHQNTEPADVVFAQRLPALIEQLALAGSQDKLEEKPIAEAEALLAHVVNPDHRHMIINNVGKGGGTGTTLKFVLRLREQPVTDQDQLIPDFVRHVFPSQKPPAPEALMGVLKLIKPELQKPVLRGMMHSDRIRKDEAEALVKTLSSQLGFPDFVEQAKAQPAMAPEIERQMAWNRIKDLMNRRADTATIAAAFRERLHEHYNGEEMKQSWITLTETDPISLIRIFCQLPYLSNGKTDPIARTVLETYVTRLTHEKYAATYNKIVNSLRNMFRAKADSPTLLNFLALVRWVSAEAADKLCTDIGMPVPAHNS